MSVKHIETYYKEICEQYQEMIDSIKDLEEAASNGLVEPERIDRLKGQVDPIKQNYERWSYMMFLLHQPQKKTKLKKYQKNNQKLLQNIAKENTLQGILEENKNAIEHIGE